MVVGLWDGGRARSLRTPNRKGALRPQQVTIPSWKTALLVGGRGVPCPAICVWHFAGCRLDRSCHCSRPVSRPFAWAQTLTLIGLLLFPAKSSFDLPTGSHVNRDPNFASYGKVGIPCLPMVSQSAFTQFRRRSARTLVERETAGRHGAGASPGPMPKMAGSAESIFFAAALTWSIVTCWMRAWRR